MSIFDLGPFPALILMQLMVLVIIFSSEPSIVEYPKIQKNYDHNIFRSNFFLNFALFFTYTTADNFLRRGNGL